MRKSASVEWRAAEQRAVGGDESSTAPDIDSLTCWYHLMASSSDFLSCAMKFF